MLDITTYPTENRCINTSIKDPLSKFDKIDSDAEPRANLAQLCHVIRLTDTTSLSDTASVELYSYAPGERTLLRYYAIKPNKVNKHERADLTCFLNFTHASLIILLEGASFMFPFKRTLENTCQWMSEKVNPEAKLSLSSKLT